MTKTVTGEHGKKTIGLMKIFRRDVWKKETVSWPSRGRLLIHFFRFLNSNGHTPSQRSQGTPHCWAAVIADYCREVSNLEKNGLSDEDHSYIKKEKKEEERCLTFLSPSDDLEER